MNISGTAGKESALGFYDVSSILLPRRFKVVDESASAFKLSTDNKPRGYYTIIVPYVFLLRSECIIVCCDEPARIPVRD